ncbi:MAG: ABC transporter ATP-binding protein [Pseudomonadales bacterium]|jgi:ATP-binding cassette subfamily B protein|tara:strand:+ start:1339 stop:3195 length:1857 start_codon:yes stop_codon:yes gene_type:complete
MLAHTEHASKAQKLWPLFLTIAAGFRGPLLMALLAMVASFVLMFTVPMIIRSMLDRLTGEAPDTYLTWLQILIPTGLSDNQVLYLQLGLSGLLIILCTALAGYFVYLRGKQIAAAAEGMARRLRDTLMNHLNHLPIAFHHQADTGDLIQRCTSDIETFRVFVSGQIIEIGRAVLMLLIVTPILLSLDVTMTGVALITMPLLLVSAVLFFNRVKSMFLEVDEAEASLTTVLQENLTGIRVVRAFARQDFEAEKFGRANVRFRDQNQRLMRFLGFYYGASDIVCLFQVGLILFVGAHWVLADTMTIGTLFAFITYEGMIIWPIRHMGRVLTDSGKAVVALKRMAEILSEPEESNLEQALTAPLTGEIRLDRVSFHHPDNPPVLSNLSLTIAAGETVALVGAPGAGKSTLIQLLLRLYDPQQGTLWVDQFDLSQLSRKSVRAQIGVVLQESFLFAGSIADNLRIGQSQASLADMTEAVKTANLLGTINALPNGFESLVGERGVTLSGGQRQRLAIARALLKDPAILILDDALSAVDTDTESLILENLRRVRFNRTTLIVAHRLSTVMQADRIVVLDGGEVTQTGNHATLSQVPGIYRQLCELQGQVQQEIQQSRTPEDSPL